MQTTAREIADKLNEYEATHTAENHNMWDDVILHADWYDDVATDKADPNYECNVVVLTDGTRIERHEGKWVVEGSISAHAVTRVRSAQWVRERAEATLHERIREAAAEGVSERDLAEASGISRTKVRRILGREKP